MRDRSLVALSKKNLKEGAIRSFETSVRGHLFRGFVVHKAGKFYGYQNLCRHLAVTLDAGRGDFLTHDKRHLQCHLHGATYEIETGRCIGGPCEGAYLVALECIEEEKRIIVLLPEGFGRKEGS